MGHASDQSTVEERSSGDRPDDRQQEDSTTSGSSSPRHKISRASPGSPGKRLPEAIGRRRSRSSNRSGLDRPSPRSSPLQAHRRPAAPRPSPSFSRTAVKEESGYWGDVDERDAGAVANVSTERWSEVRPEPWQMAQEQMREAPSRQPGEGVTVVLDVVTDIVCPYSYIGHLKIAKAIEAARKAASPIDVVVYHHPFQLDSSLPEDHVIDRDERLAVQHKEKLPAFVDSVNRKGKSVGVALKSGGPIRQTTNAHRLMMLAGQRGGPALQLPFVSSLYDSYWEDLTDPGDPDMLADKAARARIFHDRDEAKEWILGDDMRDELRSTYAKMKSRGIKGVPFIVINRKFAICGAQEPEELLELFRKVSRGEPPGRSAPGSPTSDSGVIITSSPTLSTNVATHDGDLREKAFIRVSNAARANGLYQNSAIV